MTHPTSVIALFCEDIREDKSGTLSLIGIFGDNAVVPPLPSELPNARGLIPKLCVYIRIYFDVDSGLGPIRIKLILPDGKEMEAGSVDDATIAQAKSTKENGNPMASVIARFQLNYFVTRDLGRLQVVVSIGAQSYLAGYLNIMAGAASDPQTIA